MRSYFIYQYEDLISSKDKMRITVIFIHQAKITSQNGIAQEINTFFQENSITDKLVVLLPSYLDDESLSYFFDLRDLTFIRVPGKSTRYFDECLVIYKYQQDGGMELIYGEKPKNENKFKTLLFRSGATIIFKNNGGLVESTPDHHFVFPSNKHCSKFIRTGNVLINQSEIFFLAIQLLKHFEGRTIIYCDTSSINALPYAVFELFRRFGVSFVCPTVHSFESYEVFESHKDSFPQDSLVLISSSTSGNIIDRILNEKRAEKSQIQVVYFLGSNEKYLNHASNIICNLTKEESFTIGENEFDTFSNSSVCKLCLNHSRPISIRSDVFLTVQPKIEKHLLTVRPEYAPKNISSFVRDFRGSTDKDGVIRVFYKENDANADYEIYFDFVHLIDNIKKYNKFEEALNRYIDKSIPANTKYFLYLPDAGSEKLVDYIVSRIPNCIKPVAIKLEQGFTEKMEEENGSVVIVASCITTGKKLLQISRLLRNRVDLNLIYFVGIYRPISEDFSRDLINDLRKGQDKSDERPFIAVEKINCSIRKVNTTWEAEAAFFEELLGSINEEDNNELYSFVNDRLDILRDNKKQRGLSDNVFLKKFDGGKLVLRKNFAFWNFNTYSEDDVAQSEVYFTISTIITNLENNNINSHPSLKQTNYVRNILSPRNFHRFNDGIIQAALLRSGKTEYFSYDLDNESSLQMKEFLHSIIEKYDSEDGEALLEFILAIGLKKLKLKKEDLIDVMSLAKACENKVIQGISNYALQKIGY